MSRGNKKLTFYVLSTIDNPRVFLTINVDKKETIEFAHALMKVNNWEHYNMWCDLRSYDPEDTKVWMKYFRDCVTDEEKEQYKVQKVIYKFKDVAAILRMFGGCLPLGCSFDTPTEYDYLNYKLEAQKRIGSKSEVAEDVGE